jgi:hypothetical protein
MSFGFVDCSNMMEICKEAYPIEEFPIMFIHRPVESDRTKIERMPLPMDYYKVLYLLFREHTTKVKEINEKSLMNALKSTIDDKKIPLIYFYIEVRTIYEGIH